MKLILLILSACAAISTQAQMNCEGITYEVTTFIESYTDLNEEDVTSLTQGLVWDDPEFQFNIGFDFPFFNQTTSELALIGDLYGSGLVGNPSTIKNSLNAILPAYADYTDLAYAQGLTDGDEGGLSHISHLTEGEEGNRIFKLEWKNVGFYNEVSQGSSDSYLNVQLWLYEVDGAIEFRYGDYSIENPTFVLDGAESPISGLICSLNLDGTEGNGIILGGDAAAPEIELFNNQPSGFDTMPEINRVYRWERAITAAISELSEKFTVTASPVPFTDQLTLSSANGFEKIQLLDLTGKVLFESTESSKELTIDTSELPSSIYFLRAEKESDYYTIKIVK